MKTKFHIPHSTFQPGFLIIEVLIALAIFLVTLTIFGLAVSTIPLTKTARNQNLAYHIAAKKLEELRDTPYASLPVNGTSSFSDTGFGSLPSPTGQLVIANYGSGPVKLITVTVTWQESGTARTAILETLMSNPGLNQ